MLLTQLSISNKFIRLFLAELQRFTCAKNPQTPFQHPKQPSYLGKTSRTNKNKKERGVAGDIATCLEFNRAHTHKI